MGVYADDVTEFSNSDSSDDENRPPLGERLRGMAEELNLDSIDELTTNTLHTA
ncbi:hypothetical protein [Natrononativus amylolyticus]|uniref:hypothetical protein n=1 Tax=Natrononativus amylolyticus TaxID=2963434 RepID=UPI0020CC35EF|nr:hypothetical protein [Natrononativus amylolyticus]